MHKERDLFNGPLSRTTRVSRYQKGKPIWILLKQETVSGSGISWAVCKSAPHSRQITMAAPHHSFFYRPDALPAAQPTASKHWRQILMHKATDKYRSTFCHLLTQKWLKAYAQTTTINDLRCHTNTTELKKTRIWSSAGARRYYWLRWLTTAQFIMLWVSTFLELSW